MKIFLIEVRPLPILVQGPYLVDQVTPKCLLQKASRLRGKSRCCHLQGSILQIIIIKKRKTNYLFKQKKRKMNYIASYVKFKLTLTITPEIYTGIMRCFCIIVNHVQSPILFL